MSNEECDSLFSVTKLFKRFYDPDGNPINHDPKKLINTQELSPLFEENSCMYLFTRKSFEVNRNRIGEKPYMFEIDKIEAIDIDDEFDFELVKNIIYTQKH
jgi:CMP-N-acetylneuraminic acid synthetase